MTTFKTPRRALSLVLGVTATIAVALPVAATDVVTQEVTAGTRTASVADLALDAAAYSHNAQSSTGSMTLTADDSTGSNAGWNVTIESSDFVWTAGSGGASTGTDIAAANFSLTSASAATSTAGQAVDVDTDTTGPDIANGPMVPSESPVGTLDSARKTIQANAEYGNGTYTQDLGVSLTIPAQSAAGTYTGTLTTLIAAAP